MKRESKKILVVDDQEDWRITIQGLLEDDGFEVEVASSVAEAEEKLQKSFFDLAVLDMRLDETEEDNRDGLNILAKIIKEKYPNTKAIILTGYADNDSTRAMEPGDDERPLVYLHMEKTETDSLIDNIKNII